MGAALEGGGAGRSPANFFLMIFCRFLEKFLGLERQNSWKYGISKKSGPGMTDKLRPSRREVKNDVS